MNFKNQFSVSILFMLVDLGECCVEEVQPYKPMMLNCLNIMYGSKTYTLSEVGLLQFTAHIVSTIPYPQRWGPDSVFGRSAADLHHQADAVESCPGLAWGRQNSVPPPRCRWECVDNNTTQCTRLIISQYSTSVQ